MEDKKSQPFFGDISGHLFLIVGPSGAGKSTLIDYILKVLPDLHFPISVTTREPRAEEIPGQDYKYLSVAEFEAKIASGELLEYALVHGQTYYGTLISEVIEPLQKGVSVIRHIDFQGAQSIKELIPRKNLHIIFIDAGNWSELERRIKGRGEITPEQLEKRRLSYEKELSFISEADLVIVNPVGKLSAAQKQLEDYILKAINN